MPVNARKLIERVRVRLQEEAAAQVSGKLWQDPELLDYLNEGGDVISLELLSSQEDFLITFRDISLLAGIYAYDIPPCHLKTRYVEYIAGGQRIHISESRVSDENQPWPASTGVSTVEPILTYALAGDQIMFDGTPSSAIQNAIRHWFERSLPEMTYGKATAGGASSITLQAADDANGIARPFDDADLDRSFIALTGGAGAGQRRRILSYDGDTGIATIDPAWTTQPDSTSLYATETVIPAPFHRMLVNFAVMTAKNKIKQDARAYSTLFNAWHDLLISTVARRTATQRYTKPFDPYDGVYPGILP